MNSIKTNIILTSMLVATLLITSCSNAYRVTNITRFPTIRPVTKIKPVITPPKTPIPTPTPTPPPNPTPNPVPTPMPINQGIKKSTYYWGKFNPATINSYIDNIAANGIAIIYLDFEPYAYDNYSINQAISELAPVIRYAKSKNVNIHGLIGSPTFAQPTEQKFVLKIMEIIKQFNSSQVTPITGVHLNIEFYNAPQFRADTGITVKTNYLTNYLDFHKTLGQLTRTIQNRFSSFELSSTLPHFTDFESSDNPIIFVTYDQQRLSIFEHVAKILNQTPNSSIVIMSYRSFATGEDSITGLIKKEFGLVAKYKTKIVVAVETNDQKDSKISMYGKTKNEIDSIITQVADVYKNNPNFGGIAIHEIKAYLAAR